MDVLYSELCSEDAVFLNLFAAISVTLLCQVGSKKMQFRAQQERTSSCNLGNETRKRLQLKSSAPASAGSPLPLVPTDCALIFRAQKAQLERHTASRAEGNTC